MEKVISNVERNNIIKILDKTLICAMTTLYNLNYVILFLTKEWDSYESIISNGCI